MAITLGQLKVNLNYSLGTSETNFYTNDKRVDALNTAINNILEMYQIPQYLQESTLTFTSGIAPYPATALMPVKIWGPNNDEYLFVHPNDFDSEIPYTVTVKYNTLTEIDEIYAWPNNVTSLTIRYINLPDPLVADSDKVRFSKKWEDGITKLAAYFLFLDAQKQDQAASAQVQSRQLITNAWQMETKTYDSPELNVLQSAYDKISLLHTVRPFTTN
jgi:hypothetical protein